ncbi:MAG: DMT family transporter [Candidatus Paceibacterota bacterium]
MWIVIALIAPASYAVANIFDTLLTTRSFKNPFTLTFYSSLFNILFIPVLFLFDTPTPISLQVIPIFILLGLINIGYLYPYYKGLQSDETSTAVSFFGIGRIFIPINAFLIVGEKLHFAQYVGVALIMVSVILLSIKPRIEGSIKFSKALRYITCAAFITSFEGVLLKYLFNQGVSISTAISGELAASLLIACSFLMIPHLRQDIKKHFSLFKQKAHLFLTEEIFTFIAFTAESVAIKMAPVSLVKSITIFTPFFILFYAKFFGKRFAHLFNEAQDRKTTIKKIILFMVLSLGIILVSN